MELRTFSPHVSESGQEGSNIRATVVIADAGANATVVVVESHQPLSVGSRFSYQGVEWRITCRRPHSRAFVAEPIEA